MRKKHPFRHALLAAVGTVSGIVLLIALKPTTDPSLPQAGSAVTSNVAVSPSASSHSASTSASPSSSKSSKASEKKRTASPSPSAPSSARASSTAPAAPTRTSSAPSAPKTTEAASTTRTVTGATAQTNYGPVQVRITLTGGKITAANAVQYPDETARSKDINSTAIPKLNQETLQAQSADIDTVSGATYTSAGYKQSLQSALDQAGV